MTTTSRGWSGGSCGGEDAIAVEDAPAPVPLPPPPRESVTGWRLGEGAALDADALAAGARPDDFRPREDLEAEEGRCAGASVW
jgi:hypothetical protein